MPYVSLLAASALPYVFLIRRGGVRALGELDIKRLLALPLVLALFVLMWNDRPPWSHATPGYRSFYKATDGQLLAWIVFCHYAIGIAALAFAVELCKRLTRP